MNCTVKWYNDGKGYGFLTSESHDSIFVHYTAITDSGFKTLTEGQAVTCEIVDGPKGPLALNVVKS